MSRIRTIKPEAWKLDREVWDHAKSHLYIIQEHDGPIKIGVAGHPIRRLSGLQSGNSRKLNLISVYAGAAADRIAIEIEFGLKFQEKRLVGEWFNMTAADAQAFFASFENEVPL